MRPLVIAIVAAVIVSILSPFAAFADPAVSVDRATGTASDTYVFSGSGFEPGTVLKAKYTTASGKEYGFTQGYGEASYSAGPDGSVSLSFSPASSPDGGGSSGAWTMTFCLASDASACWSKEFGVESSGGTRGGMEGGDYASGY
jgi:hypothetical protein